MRGLLKSPRARASAALVVGLGVLVVLPGPASAFDYDSAYPTELQAVTAISATNAWAVGQVSDGQRVILDHWNGSTWSAVSSSVSGTLHGIDAASASSIWAVGGYLPAHAHQLNTLALYWNGTQWSRQSTPSPSTVANPLEDVSALSPSNAWAVGYYVDSADTSKHHALALHWNGSKWSRVSVPGTELYAVDAVSRTSVWAAGFGELLHWNGTKWSKQYVHQGLRIFHLTHLSATNAWAVGDLAVLPPGAKDSVALHWNGTKWSRRKTPDPSNVNTLSGVTAIGRRNVWAVGCHGSSLACDRSDALLVLHWNGTKWTKVATPHPGTRSNRLSAVASTAGSDVWAVGGYADNRTSSGQLILHWNGRRWSVKKP